MGGGGNTADVLPKSGSVGARGDRAAPCLPVGAVDGAGGGPEDAVLLRGNRNRLGGARGEAMNPHAQALGKLGGKAGTGKAKSRTSQQARAAVMA